MCKIKAVFWDIDNTLIDTSKSREAGFMAAIEAMQRAGLPCVSHGDARERLRRLEFYFDGAWPLSLLRLLCTEYQIRDQQVLQRILDEGIKSYRSLQGDVYVKEGVISTLKKLKDQGLRLGVISNSLAQEQIAKLRASDLLDLFEGQLILISSMLHANSSDLVVSELSGLGLYFVDGGIYRLEKPWLTLFDEARRRVGCEAREILFIGDLRADVIGAKVAGWRTALLLRNRQGKSQEQHQEFRLQLEQPDHIVDCPVDVLGVLQNCNCD